MTGQNLLDRMEMLNAELQLQPGESDVTKGLTALNVAQDYFESLAAARGTMLWGTSTGTVVTAASTETTAFPSGLLRLDRVQVVDGTSLIDLIPVRRTGGHRQGFGLTSGKPSGYWQTGTYFYWSPLPNGVYTLRWYGLQSASDITAGGTFAYPDIVALPLASFACQLIKIGLDDDGSAIGSLATSTFTSALQTLEMTNRDGAKGLAYTRVHQE